MVPKSPSSRTSALKTYSKRANYSTEGPPRKKQRVEEPPPVNSIPQIEKIKGATIRSYFKPLRTPSNPISKRSPQPSSDLLEPTSTPPSSCSPPPPPPKTDPLQPTSTPPSSPPPRTEPSIESPRKPQKRPKRRITTRPVLAPLVNMSSQQASDNFRLDAWQYDILPPKSNALPHSANAEDQGNCESNKFYPSSSSPNVARPSTRSLQQTQLDMGVAAIKTCKECGMQYNTTLADERSYHEKYHRYMLQAKQPSAVPARLILMEKFNGTDQHLVRVFDYQDSAALQKYAKQAIRVTQQTLGNWTYSDIELWSLIFNPQNENDPNPVPKFKVYTYLVNLHLVGVVVAQRIGGIRGICLGIDRVWVREDMRQQGIATKLVDCAREDFIPGLIISKDDFSFCELTEEGHKFAAKYCGDGEVREHTYD